MIKNYLKFFVVAVLFSSCENNKKLDTNIVEVDQITIGNHIERIASDEFLGRKPFTEGEVKTVNYLKDEFEKLGLLPGNGKSFFQEVPMVEITGIPSENMTISGKNKSFGYTLTYSWVIYPPALFITKPFYIFKQLL